MSAGNASTAAAREAAILEVFRERRASAFATRESDRTTSERLIRGVYARLARPEPRLFWCDGPISCVLLYNLVRQRERERARRRSGTPLPSIFSSSPGMRFQILAVLRANLTGQIDHELGGSMLVNVERGMGLAPGESRRLDAHLSESSFSPLEIGEDVAKQLEQPRLLEGLATRYGAEFGIEPGMRLPEAWEYPEGLWGGEGMIWTAICSGCARLGASLDAATRALIHDWDGLQHACGVWFPFPHAVICSERPTHTHLDAQFRQHREDGPALEWPEGCQFYARHGMPAPKESFEQRTDPR